MPGRERKRIPGHGSNISKGSLPQGPVHHHNTEDVRLSEEESRDEATQEMYGRTVPETMQKQVKPVLY